MQTSIIHISKNECYAIIGYLYNFYKNSDVIKVNDSVFTILAGLIVKFKKDKQAERVIEAFITKNIQEKHLTLFTPDEDYKNPFGYYSGSLERNFQEDITIANSLTNYDKNISYIMEFFIDLSRCLFVNQNDFSKIIALILFGKEINDTDTFMIPKKIKIPKHITKAVNNVKPVDFLIKALKLSNKEAQLLLLSHRCYIIWEMYEFCNDIYDNINTRIAVYSKCLNTSYREINELFRFDKKLVSFNFMYSDGTIYTTCKDCISLGSLEPFFVETLKEERTDNFFDISSYSIKKEYSDLALQFLKSNCASNILLYGNPGSGKTEFAKTLAAQSGLKLFIFKNEMENINDNDKENSLYRLNCLLSIQKLDSVIVVDEAENILQTKSSFLGMQFTSPKKGIVNKMLENSLNKVIWILNYTDGLDDSTLRRFTYSIKFGEMPKSMLQSIAYSKLKNINVKGKLLNELADLCSSYRVTGASITNMVKTVNSRVNENEEKIIIDVRNMLEANSALLYGTSNISKKLQDSYELEALNTSVAPNEIVEMVKNAVEYSKSTEIKTGIRMLFYGLSGTGKTEFARYIAESLDKKLILKKASDILGKYVGESEQHIKEAFEEALTEDAILLFDEADSFYTNRVDVNHSWERTMVNEFLMQMEDFNGLLICTTNIKELMDPAMQRRFHIMTEFKAMNENGIRTLLTKYFASI